VAGQLTRANAIRGKKKPTLIGARLSKSPVRRRHHLLTKVAESIGEEVGCHFQGAAVFFGCLSIRVAGEPVDCRTH
jgi:hypothetical protein